MEEFLKFGFYPGLAFFAVVCLYVIAISLEEINKKDKK